MPLIIDITVSSDGSGEKATTSGQEDIGSEEEGADMMTVLTRLELPVYQREIQFNKCKVSFYINEVFFSTPQGSEIIYGQKTRSILGKIFTIDTDVFCNI